MGNFTFTSSSIASHSTAASSTVVGCLWYYQGLFRFSCSSTLVRVLCLPCLSRKGRQQRTTHSNDSNDDLYYVCVRRYLSKPPSLPHTSYHQPTTQTTKLAKGTKYRSAEKSSATHHRLLQLISIRRGVERRRHMLGQMYTRDTEEEKDEDRDDNKNLLQQ